MNYSFYVTVFTPCFILIFFLPPLSLCVATLQGEQGRKGPANTGMCHPLALNTSHQCNTKLCKVFVMPLCCVSRSLVFGSHVAAPCVWADLTASGQRTAQVWTGFGVSWRYIVTWSLEPSWGPGRTGPHDICTEHKCVLLAWHSNLQKFWF